MKKEIKQPLKITDVLRLSCLYFAPIFFIINFICALISGNGVMLVPWASALIFALTFIVALIISIVKKPCERSAALSIITNCCCFFAAISFIITLVVFIINDGSIWNLWGLLLVLSVSTVISLLMYFVKLKSFLVSAFMYYAVSVASFMVLITGVGKYTQGNIAIISFSIYSSVFVVSAIVYFFIKRSFEQIENEEKTYKRQFD